MRCTWANQARAQNKNVVKRRTLNIFWRFSSLLFIYIYWYVLAILSLYVFISKEFFKAIWGTVSSINTVAQEEEEELFQKSPFFLFLSACQSTWFILAGFELYTTSLHNHHLKNILYENEDAARRGSFFMTDTHHNRFKERIGLQQHSKSVYYFLPHLCLLIKMKRRSFDLIWSVTTWAGAVIHQQEHHLFAGWWWWFFFARRRLALKKLNKQAININSSSLLD